MTLSLHAAPKGEQLAHDASAPIGVFFQHAQEQLSPGSLTLSWRSSTAMSPGAGYYSGMGNAAGERADAFHALSAKNLASSFFFSVMSVLR